MWKDEDDEKGDTLTRGDRNGVLVAARVALAVEKIGTNAGEALRGTAQHDTLYGRGGDRLLGKKTTR